jgi:hypothetical protein
MQCENDQIYSVPTNTVMGKGLWYLTPLSTKFQLYRGGQFYWLTTGVPGKNHRPTASHRQTLTHNGISSTLSLSGSPTHNVSGDRH